MGPAREHGSAGAPSSGERPGNVRAVRRSDPLPVPRPAVYEAVMAASTAMRAGPVSPSRPGSARPIRLARSGSGAAAVSPVPPCPMRGRLSVSPDVADTPAWLQTAGMGAAVALDRHGKSAAPPAAQREDFAQA